MDNPAPEIEAFLEHATRIQVLMQVLYRHIESEHNGKLVVSFSAIRDGRLMGGINMDADHEKQEMTLTTVNAETALAIFQSKNMEKH